MQHIQQGVITFSFEYIEIWFVWILCLWFLYASIHFHPGPSGSKIGWCCPLDKSLSEWWMTLYILLSLICWIVTYPLDGIVCPLYNWALVWNKGELEYLHTFHISHNCFFFQCLLWIVSVTWRLLTIKMKGKTWHFNQTSVVFKWIIRMSQWIYIYIHACKKCKIFWKCTQTIRTYKEKKWLEAN